MILFTGCNMRTPGREYYPEIYFEGSQLTMAQAIFNDDAGELKKLLKQETINISVPGKEGYTLLLYAIEISRYKMMELLLEYGADPNVISPTMYVPGAGKQSDPSYDIPIHTACYNKYPIKYLKLLVKHGANVNENRQKSPLFRAINSRDEGKINFLLKNGADVNIQAKYGTTSLITAAELSWFEMVERLLDLGADPFIEVKGTSLQKAMQYYIERTEGGSQKGRQRTRQLIRRLEGLGMEFDYSKAKFQMTD